MGRLYASPLIDSIYIMNPQEMMNMFASFQKQMQMPQMPATQMPYPYHQNGYNPQEEEKKRMDAIAKEIQGQFEKSLIMVFENPSSEFSKKMKNVLKSYIADLEDEDGDDDEDDDEKDSWEKKRDKKKSDKHRVSKECEEMRSFWKKVENIEEKAGTQPGFNIESSLKKDIPSLEEKEVKVFAYFVRNGGMHRHAKSLGMDVKELHEMIEKMAEKAYSA